MIYRIFVMAAVLMLAGAVICMAQAKPSASKAISPPATAPDLQPIRSSPAYAEIVLHRAELESTLDSLLIDYTEDYPKVKEIRIELGFVKFEMDRMLAVKPSDAGRLSVALGRLMLRKIELETELDTLRAQYKDEHPDVKKTKKKIEVFESAIKEILG